MEEYHLNKLTIIIPTCNRHQLLKRTIKYWSNYNVNLLILDGSDKRFDDACLNSSKIKYIFDNKSLSDRLWKYNDYIKTEFVILGCDDEFYLQSALSKSIQFLLDNPDYSCCAGLTAIFSKKTDDQFYIKDYYTKLENISLEEDSSYERVKKLFSNYVPNSIFSVIRSNIWKVCSKNVFKNDFGFFAADELMFEFLVLVSGKSKKLKELMQLRNGIEIPVRNTDEDKSRVLNKTIRKLWFNKNFKKKRENFLIATHNACHEVLINTKIKFSKEMISEIIELYVKRSLLKIFLQLNLIIKINSFCKSIIIRLKKIFIVSKSSSWIDYINIFETQGILVNNKDLDKVISAIKNS